MTYRSSKSIHRCNRCMCSKNMPLKAMGSKTTRNPFSPWGTWTPSNSPMPRPTPLTAPNGIRIQSASRFATVHFPDRHTDTHIHTHTQTDRWSRRETCIKSAYALIESDALIMLSHQVHILIVSVIGYGQLRLLTTCACSSFMKISIITRAQNGMTKGSEMTKKQSVCGRLSINRAVAKWYALWMVNGKLGLARPVPLASGIQQPASKLHTASNRRRDKQTDRRTWWSPQHGGRHAGLVSTSQISVQQHFTVQLKIHALHLGLGLVYTNTPIHDLYCHAVGWTTDVFGKYLLQY